MLVEAAARSEPRNDSHICDQLLALAEAASQDASGGTLPMLRVAAHHRDDSTGRYAGNTPSLGHHSSSGSPAVGLSPPHHSPKPGKRGRAARATARADSCDDGQPQRKYRKYASNVPRMGRIPWIDNRHTDKKLRSKYAGVTQVLLYADILTASGSSTPHSTSRPRCGRRAFPAPCKSRSTWVCMPTRRRLPGVWDLVLTGCQCIPRCYDRAAYHFKGDRAVLNHMGYDYARDPFILVRWCN